MNDNSSAVESRRLFLRRASLAVVALPFLPLAATSCASESGVTEAKATRVAPPPAGACDWCGAADAPEKVSWQARFAAAGEPGEPLVMSGTVFLPDGRTPAPGVLIYAYHTDVRGLYRSRDGEHMHGRLRGWMRTDARGRYEFTSIRPASYPNSDNPQHVHVTLSAPDFPEHWVESFLFADDPLLTERHRTGLSGRGGFDPIVRLTRDGEGLWRGTRDMRLERTA